MVYDNNTNGHGFIYGFFFFFACTVEHAFFWKKCHFTKSYHGIKKNPRNKRHTFAFKVYKEQVIYFKYKLYALNI